MSRRYCYVAALTFLAGLTGLNGEARSFPSGKSLIASRSGTGLVLKIHGSHQTCIMGPYEYIVSGRPRPGPGGKPVVPSVTVKNGYNFHRHSLPVEPGRWMGSPCELDLPPIRR